MKITPVITEKSMLDAKVGRYTFYVDLGLTKSQIKDLINRIFGVHVVTIKTMTKKKRTKTNYKGRKIIVSGKKKTIVSLKEKEKIDLFETKEGKK